MNPPLDLHAPIPILQPVAGSRLSVVAGEGLSQGPIVDRSPGAFRLFGGHFKSGDPRHRRSQGKRLSAAPPRPDATAARVHGDTTSGSRHGTDADPV